MANKNNPTLKRLGAKQGLYVFSIVVLALASIWAGIMINMAGVNWLYALLPYAIGAVLLTFAITIGMGVNLRFAHSFKVVGSFSAVFLLLLGMFIAMLIFIPGQVMGYGALIIECALLLFSAISMMVSHHTAKENDDRIASVAVITVLLAVAAIFFMYGLSRGFFGQGAKNRPVSFSLSEDSTYYIVDSCVDGDGNVIVIPSSFNGKEVGAINLDVFSQKGVRQVFIEAKSDIKFIGGENFTAPDKSLSIFAPKETLSSITSTIYKMSRDDSKRGDSLLALAQCVAPSNLAEDEVFITFSYTSDTINNIGDSPLPMWIGKRGDVFELSKFSDISYIKDSDNQNPELLHKLFSENANNGGYILADIKDSAGKSIIGKKINDNISNIIIDFNKIYRVKVENGNDTRYTMSEKFTTTVIEDGKVGYRYITDATIDTILNNVDTRAGFNLKLAFDLDDESFGNISDAVTYAKTSGLEDIVVTPTWTLNPPTLTEISTNKLPGSYIYGDDAELWATGTSPIDEVSLSYQWIRENGAVVGDATNLNIDNLPVTAEGKYTLVCTAGAADFTSLTSSASRDVYVKVNPKQLTPTWMTLSSGAYNRTYDSLTETINVEFGEDSGLINSDIADYTITNRDTKNYGTYNAEITLKNDFARKYYIPEDAAKKTYNVDKKVIDIEWPVNTTLTFNASEQSVVATIVPGFVCGDDVVALEYAGKQYNVGTDYQVTAVSSNDNYRINSAMEKCGFEIIPLVLNIEWDYNTLQPYTGVGQAPTPAITSGKLPGEVLPSIEADKSTYELTNINALTLSGDNGYTASAILKNNGQTLASNYVINPEQITSAKYGIAKREVSFMWPDAPSYVYNGQERYPEPTPVGIISGETLNIIITGKGIHANVGEAKYTAEASIADRGDFLASNYTLIGTLECDFTITPKSVTVNWTNTNLTYNGLDGRLPNAATLDFIPGESLDIEVVANGDTAKNAGNYSAKAIIKNTGDYFASDYMIAANETVSFNVVKKAVSITWSATTRPYDTTSTLPIASTVDFANGEELNISVSSDKSFCNAGSYKLTAALQDTGSYLASNYEIIQGVENSFTITPVEIKLTWSLTDSWAYDGQEHRRDAYVESGVLGSDTVELSYTNGFKNANIDGQKYNVTAASTNGNYYVSDDTKSSTFTITPKSVIIDWTQTALTYSGKNQMPTANTSSFVTGETITIVVTPIGGSKKNAGSYEARAELQNYGSYLASNYEITVNETTSFTIAPKSVTITWTNTSLTYNGAAQKPIATIGGLISGESIGTSVTTDMTAINVYSGYSATVALIGNGSDNYVIVSGDEETTFNIIPYKLQISWSGAPLVYTGSAQAPAVSFITSSISGKLLPGLRVQASSIAGNINATTSNIYTARAELYDANGESASNYEIVNPDTPSAYGIEKATVTLNWSTNLTHTYNGEKFVATVTNFDSALCEIKYYKSGNLDEAIGEPIEAGQYVAVVTLRDNNNYKISGDFNRDFVINQKTVSVKWSAVASKVYDGDPFAPTPTVTGADSALYTISYYSLANPSTAISMPTDAGSYSVVITLSDTKNYVLSGLDSKDFVIEQRTVEIKWRPVTEFTYDGINAYGASVYDFDTSLCNIKYYASANLDAAIDKPINAGSYLAVISLKDTKNYKMNGTSSQEFIVKPQEVSLSWSSAITKEYDGVAFAASVIGFNSELCEIKYYTAEDSLNAINKPTDVGTYWAVVTLKDKNNYVFADGTVTQKEFTITPKQVSVTWSSNSNEYNGNAFAPTPTVTGADSSLYEVKYYTQDNQNIDMPVDAGGYIAKVTIDSGNYQIFAGAEQPFTITPCKLTASWSNLSFTYEQHTSHNPSVSISGVLPADSANVLVAVVTAPKNTAGTYTAKAELSGARAFNYDIVNAEQEFVIEKIKLQVEWNVDNGYEYEYSGYVSGPALIGVDNSLVEAKYYNASDLEFTNPISAPSEVGEYIAVATLTDSVNYELVGATALTFKITTLTLDLTWDSEAHQVSGGNQEYALTYTYKVKDGTEYVLYGDGAVAPTEAGEYMVIAALEAENDNVLLNNAQYTYTIIAANADE